jgi:hypothetical protein
MAGLRNLGGFAQGFVETHLALQKQQLLRDTLLQREQNDREELKLRKQEIDGRAAWRQLKEREFLAGLEQKQQELQQRAQAGSALGLLQADLTGGLGFQLDPQSQGELQGIVTTQQAREGEIGEGLKRFQQHQQARQVVAGISLEGLPEPQQQVGHAALSAFQQGRLSGDGLFQVLNRFGTAGTAKTRGGRRGTRADLAMQAAQGDAEAQRALELMSAGERSMSSAELVWRAAGGDQRAQQALEHLQGLRTPPRSGRRKERTIPEPGPGDHPTTYRGSSFQGKGSAVEEDEDDLPKVRAFRRVR